MSALAIDLGDKRCGVAVEIDGLSFPKDIVVRTKIVSSIKKYLVDYNISTIVVGLPYDLYGKNLKQLDKTKKFIDKLIDIFPQSKIVGFDERFSSFEASNILTEYGVLSQRGKKDDLSAQIILENYLAREKNRKI